MNKKGGIFGFGILGSQEKMERCRKTKAPIFSTSRSPEIEISPDGTWIDNEFVKPTKITIITGPREEKLSGGIIRSGSTFPLEKVIDEFANAMFVRKEQEKNRR